MADHLARNLVDAAFALRLKLAGVHGSPFLLRLEDEPLPLSGVLTETDELVLMRGERAFASLVDMMYGEDDSPESQAWDLLSLAFLPLDAIAFELRGILLDAGCTPRRGEPAPCFLVQRPGRHGRGPNRGEAKLLLAALRALLRALELGRFEPWERDETRRDLLELVAHGHGRSFDVEARRAPWPAPVELPQPEETLADLPLGEERWFIDLLIHPETAGLEELNRGVLFIASLRTETLLAHELVDLDDVHAFAHEISLMAQKLCESAALRPSSVEFADERLIEPLDAVLLDFDLAPARGERPAFLHKVADDFRTQLATRDAALRAGTLDSKGWEQAHRRVTMRLYKATQEKRNDVALTRYFGKKRDGEAVLSDPERVGALAAFFEWRQFDHRSSPGAPTVAEELAADPALLEVERAILAARAAARFSIFRIDEFLAGHQARLVDVVTGLDEVVNLSQIATDLTLDENIPFRLYRLGEETFAAQGGPSVPLERLFDLLEEFERCGPARAEEPRPGALLFGRLCAELLDEPRAPELTNTDGDPLQPLRATFHVAAPEVLRCELAGLADVASRGEDRWAWLRPSSAGPDVPRARLASLALSAGELSVEVNSTRRLASVRRWLDALPGVRYVGAEEGEPPVLDPFPRTRAPLGPATPADIEHLTRLHDARCRTWPDEPIPLLGGESPREAVLTPAGRRRVFHLIHAMPATRSPAGPLRAPRAWLLAELGFARRDSE
jgi:hypothetical protein